MYRRRARRMCVGSYVPDPQMVILENLGATLLLNDVMHACCAPSNHRLFVPPCRQRQNPARTTPAFEALVLHKAIDLFQSWPQTLRQSQIVVEPLRLWPNFENG